MKLKALAHDGVLRTAINTGNRALVQGDANTLAGISPALARRLADEIGATMTPVVYSGAGRVFADAQQDKWDVGFLAIDPQRARSVAFTRPYLTIEATYAVRADSDFHDVDDVDRSGVQVLTSVRQAMVLPDPQAPLIAALDDFVARAIGDGFVASIMAETGCD